MSTVFFIYLAILYIFFPSFTNKTAMVYCEKDDASSKMHCEESVSCNGIKA